MAFRTRRQARYLRLRNSGFNPFEARPLSKVPAKICPYFRAMIAERRDMLRQARRLGTTQKGFEAQIKELYRINGWLKKNRKGQVIADPWKFLRDYEDKWRAKQPQYTSPWESRLKDWREYQRKIEATFRKQGGL